MILILKTYKERNKFYYFNLIYISWCLGSLFNYHIFNRSVNFLCFFIPFIYMWYRNEKNNNRDKLRKKSIISTYMLALVITHLVYYFGSFQYNLLCF